LREILPQTARIGWDGESRECLESGSSLYITFALVIVFLVLAAQFETEESPRGRRTCARASA
jgi:multidrug efflux pump subunit AcrB